jgi:hypothetical protein
MQLRRRGRSDDVLERTNQESRGLVSAVGAPIKIEPVTDISQPHLYRFTPSPPASYSAYINVALNILRSTVCLINTTTDPRPNFSSLQNTRQAFPYTVLLVDMGTCSWKTIGFKLFSASESAMSFA